MSALDASVSVVAYLALFSAVGLGFLFVNLLVGYLVRPADPHAEKLEIYECGEPTIGSSFVQFDLRFYVVALLFIIFDVEVAFFFPWATVFGKATHLSDMASDSNNNRIVARVDGEVTLTDSARALYRELGVRQPTALTEVPESLRAAIAKTGESEALSRSRAIAEKGGHQLALLTIGDILAFFGVLLVGFAYVWKRGDLDWVRASSRQRGAAGTRASPRMEDEPEPVLSA